MIADDDVEIEVEGSQGTAAIGRVTRAGARAEGLIGARVLAGPRDPCGECDVCRSGGAPVCPHARVRATVERTLVARARWVVTLDGGLDLPGPAGATAAGDAAIAYTLYARTGISPRDRVVVIGASPVTRFLIEILLAKGIAPVVVVEPEPTRFREWLERKGIAIVAGSLGDAVLTGLALVFSMAGLGTKPLRVIATTADAVPLAAAIAGPRATLTVLAPVASLPGTLAEHEVTVIPVAGAHPDLVVEVVAMCVKGEIDLAEGTSTAENHELRAVVTGSR